MKTIMRQKLHKSNEAQSKALIQKNVKGRTTTSIIKGNLTVISMRCMVVGSNWTWLKTYKQQQGYKLDRLERDRTEHQPLLWDITHSFEHVECELFCKDAGRDEVEWVNLHNLTPRIVIEDHISLLLVPMWQIELEGHRGFPPRGDIW